MLLFVTPDSLYNGHYYSLTPYDITYTAAVTYCASLGGYLATISSADMNAAIVSFFGSSSSYWIGYTRSTLPCGDTWEWQDGSTSNYTNWYFSQPDCDGRNEACAVLNIFGEGYWNDYQCTWTLKGICSVKGLFIIKYLNFLTLDTLLLYELWNYMIVFFA